MKHWWWAALVTGIFMIPVMLRKRSLKPRTVPTASDQRYNIDDFLTEDDL
jgi:hypothetical protein